MRARTTPLSQASVLRRMLAQAAELKKEASRFSKADDDDAFIQAAVCAAPIIAAASIDVSRALDSLGRQLVPWEEAALEQAVELSRVGYAHHSCPTKLVGAVHPTSSPPAHLYEHFLHRYGRDSRKRHGVFFTPQPIADYIVSSIDRLLRDEFELCDGLATESKIQNPKSKIVLLDPACGTGVFLLAVIDYLHRTRPKHADWNAIIRALLPRLLGIEILPAAAFLAKLNLTLKLAETGYDFRQAGELQIITGDALSPNLQSEICNLKSIPIVLGNPPFSSLSTNSNDWIARLVRGDDDVRGYIRANGQQLAERKTWLHDDYVKFIRLAQWRVEEAGCGIAGLVTNHGYLDNATFRLMRHELLRVFPRVAIVDLHGGRKKAEVAPDGGRDENVFGLDQGVAIGLFCRPRRTLARSASEGNARQRLMYSELWGSRDDKLRALTDAAEDLSSIDRRNRLPSLALRASRLAPQSPDWRFVPAPTAARQPEYDSAWSLAEVMPVNTTAPVTARDHFVVAFSSEELELRIEQFRDLSIPDDKIRYRFFQRTRSARYERGDTRGWKLAEARRIVAADGDWRRYIVRCLYRPFDWRYVFWHPAMIDWPRTEVTRHLIDNELGQGDLGTRRHGESLSPCLPLSLSPPLCLIARRQQLPGHPCTFFWIADCLALDGVIRSDNRGSESLFPLYVERRANFASAFVEEFAEAVGLVWLPLGCGDLRQTFGPEDLLAYIYALFHAPSYRERYADSLRTDFPRVLFPRTAALFVTLGRYGRELIENHLLRERTLRAEYSVPQPPICSFRAGGYVALSKWLQPKHRSSSDPECLRIAHAISRTLEIIPAIDEALAKMDA